MAEKIPLSIVVTSHTVERLTDIFTLFDSIKAQTYHDIEVVFVIERSTELLEGLKDYTEKCGNYRINLLYSEKKLGLSAARNLGMESAKGGIIAFVDDDVVLFPDWAQEMVDSYVDDSIIGVTGPGLPLWEDESLNWLPEEFYWIVSCTAFVKWDEKRPVRSAWGMNMSFRKEAFEYCRFSSDFGQTTGHKEAWKAGPVDDAEFSINLRLKTGKSIIYNPKVRVQHRVYNYRLSKKFIRGQCYWQGYTKALLRKKYKQDSDTRALVRERDLLQRILFRMAPHIALQFFSRPKLALKKFTLSTTVLFYVALGYTAVTCPWLTGFTKKRFSS
ncbi:MAG: glycosyltransferase family 2 protein [Chloroflexi bacterium]|nr:glycosyltransferase family 2 protein [Chloroflexota bacterium]